MWLHANIPVNVGAFTFKFVDYFERVVALKMNLMILTVNSHITYCILINIHRKNSNVRGEIIYHVPVS